MERLPFHLPNAKPVTYKEGDTLDSVCRKANFMKSKLEAFFILCQNDDRAKKLTYQQVPEFYVWDAQGTFWKERKKGKQFGRLNLSHQVAGEMWYLRMLLARIQGPTSFVDLRTVGTQVYSSFQDTCRALGLLKGDNEWHEALKENESTAFAFQLRRLFVHIIVHCEVNDVFMLWESHWHAMADDVLYNHRKLTGNTTLILHEEEIQYYALAGTYIMLYILFTTLLLLLLLYNISLLNCNMKYFYFQRLRKF